MALARLSFCPLTVAHKDKGGDYVRDQNIHTYGTCHVGFTPWTH